VSGQGRSVFPFSGVADAVLLESTDGNGRNNTSSLLFIQNAARIEGRGNTVRIQSLSVNGRSAIAAMKPELSKLGVVTETSDGVTVAFPAERPAGDDLARIRARIPAGIIRLFSRGWNLGTDDPVKRLCLPGIVSYDHLDHLEDLPAARSDTHDFPDFVFYLPEIVVMVSHEADTARILIHGYNATSYDARYAEDGRRADGLSDIIAGIEPQPLIATDGVRSRTISDEVSVDLSDAAYADLVRRVAGHIVAGDVFQIVPSRTFCVPCDDALRSYGVLRQLNPSPYLFYVRTPGFELFGASPETSVKVAGHPLTVSIHPIAGTRPRGFNRQGKLDRDLDSRLEAELKLNEKEVAEHMMLVDLARNDIARISRPGTRNVTALLEVERYSHVMHLVSVVEGELRAEFDALHALLASSNMGTLVGAPKIEASKLLRRYEVDKRGPYGGAVGYLTSDGEMDTAIVIRAALVREGRAYVRAGAGVVFDSDPLAEAGETRAKASAVLRAIEAAGEIRS
jgi:anthranilate synthase component 1